MFTPLSVHASVSAPGIGSATLRSTGRNPLISGHNQVSVCSGKNYIDMRSNLYIGNSDVTRLTSSCDAGKLRGGFLIGMRGGANSPLADSSLPAAERRPSNSTTILNILCLYPDHTSTILSQFFLFEAGRTGGSRPRAPLKQ
jgi:hypothetical protein